MLIIVHVYVCVKLFTFFVLYFVYFLQYSDTVGWVFWPVKTVGRITYIVLAQTLNHAQPTINFSRLKTNLFGVHSLDFCSACEMTLIDHVTTY